MMIFLVKLLPKKVLWVQIPPPAPVWKNIRGVCLDDVEGAGDVNFAIRLR